MSNKFLIIGTGAWGTALASVLVANKQYVKMYGISQSQINDLKQGTNSEFFPGKKFNWKPKEVSNNLNELITDVDYILFCTPSSTIASLLKQLKPIVPDNITIINTSKGIDVNTRKNYIQIIQDEIPNVEVCSLLGPSFAIDVINKIPTIVNIVGTDSKNFKKIAKSFNNDYFKVAYCNDEIGASLVSSLKNSLAIICGLFDYYKLESNCKYAFMSQGIKEIQNILLMFGGEYETIFDFCGLGDILLTCSDKKSRNYQFGQLLGEMGVKKAIDTNKLVVEGFQTIKTIYDVVAKRKEQFPIFYLAYQLINNKIAPNKFIKKLWSYIGHN